MRRSLVRAALILVQILFASAAAAGTRGSASGAATVTILAAAEASVTVPGRLVLRDDQPRVVALAPRSDRRTAAWLEIRSADATRGVDVAVTPDRGIRLRAAEGAGAADVPLAITYHQY